MAKTTRRGGRLTRWQAVPVGAGLAVAAAVATAALLGYSDLALALLAVLSMLGFAGSLRSRRRIEELHQLARDESHRVRRYVAQEVQDRVEDGVQLAEQAHAAHRRLLATVETERLAAADRQRELLDVLDRSGAGAGAAGPRHLAVAGTDPAGPPPAHD